MSIDIIITIESLYNNVPKNVEHRAMQRNNRLEK